MAPGRKMQPADLGERAMALAEQLGRVAGTIEGTAEAWLKRRAGDAQASGRARKTTPSQAKKSKAAAATSARVKDPSRAPGKRRRKPGPSVKGARKSNEAIPKLRTANAVRRRRKSYA